MPTSPLPCVFLLYLSPLPTAKAGAEAAGPDALLICRLGSFPSFSFQKGENSDFCVPGI
jgi:hypothetical protein